MSESYPGSWEYNPRKKLARKLPSNVLDMTMSNSLDSSGMVLQVESRRRDDDEDSVREAAKSRPGQPIRLRFQPQLYFAVKNATYRSGAFFSWRNLYWNVQCPTVADALKVKGALTSFFRALAVLDATDVSMVLDTAIKLRVESPNSPVPSASVITTAT